MERFGKNYLEERNLVARWPQPVPAVVNLLFTLAIFQYVRGRFEFSEFANPKMAERFLILIGQNIQKEGITTAFTNNLFDGSRKS